MIIKIDNYEFLDKEATVSIVGTDNPNLVNIEASTNEFTVSVSDLLAAAKAFDHLRADV